MLLTDGTSRARRVVSSVASRHWADLSTALGKLVPSGYISVTGPLGRAETTYRIHERGRAALSG